MEASRLRDVRINLPGEQVEITQQERDALLQELCFVAHCRPIRERLETVGATSAAASGARTMGNCDGAARRNPTTARTALTRSGSGS